MLMFGSLFKALLGRLRMQFGTHFGIQTWIKTRPKSSPRAAKTRPQLKYAARQGGSSLFGLGVAQDEAQPRPRMPCCRPRTFNKCSNLDPENLKIPTKGRKRDPTWGTQISKKRTCKPKNEQPQLRLSPTLKGGGVAEQAKMEARS